MNWFTKICRYTGQMIHNVRNPDKAVGTGKKNTTVSRKVEEEKRGNVTLRRTTIEEIEIRENDGDDNHRDKD